MSSHSQRPLLRVDDIYGIRIGDTMITKKKVINYYFIIIGIFAIAFIAASGSSKTNIVTSNVHNVKSILSTRIVKQNSAIDNNTTTVINTSPNLGDIKE